MKYEWLEPVRPADTPADMRAEMFRLRHYNPLVRAMWDQSDYRGLSAEDKYTMIAYAALKQNIDLQSRLTYQLAVSVNPSDILAGKK